MKTTRRSFLRFLGFGVAAGVVTKSLPDVEKPVREPPLTAFGVREQFEWKDYIAALKRKQAKQITDGATAVTRGVNGQIPTREDSIILNSDVRRVWQQSAMTRLQKTFEEDVVRSLTRVI